MAKNFYLFIPAVLIYLFFPVQVSGNAKNGRSADFGDKPHPGKITGMVVDSRTSNAVEFATLALIRNADSLLITGGVTDDKGIFVLENIQPGKYRLKVNFIGFHALFIDNVAISAEKPEVNLGVIKLKSSSGELSEVEIRSEKPLVQNGIDKKVFNVEKSLVGANGSANDILQNIPSVSVDIDGGVSLRGSGSVTVLIDGKPSGLTGGSRAAILQQIPASSIESVEVITNPSAKYDPDGMAGIINIILKKNSKQGPNGNINLGIGNRDKYNGLLSLNYRNNKLNFFSNLSFRHNNSYGYGNNYRTNTFLDSVFILDQNTSSYDISNTLLFKAGVDYYINERNTIGVSGLINSRNGILAEWTESNSLDEFKRLTGLFHRFALTGTEGGNADLNMNYRKTFAKKGRLLTADANYSASASAENSDYTLQNYLLDRTPAGENPFLQDVANFSGVRLVTAQSDYVNPVEGKGKVEAGVKAIVRDIDNSLVSSDFDFTSGLWMLNQNLSNDFLFKERVLSAYGIFSGTMGKFNYQSGLRAEQTLTTSNQKTTGEVFTNNYFNLFPSVHILRKIDKSREVQLSYSKRINRPSVRSLNPFVNFSDPLNLQTGNPKLNPEYIHSVEFSAAKTLDKMNISSSVYFRRTENTIQRFRTVDSTGVSTTQFLNLNNATSYGFELTARNEVFKWWNVTSNLNLFRMVIDGKNLDGDLTNATFSWHAKVMSSMKPDKRNEIQFSGNYRAPNVTPQGTMYAMWSADIALKRDILEGKGSFSLNVSDIFNSRRFGIEGAGVGFTQSFVRKRESRVVNLGFTYRFGKGEPVARRRQGRNDHEREESFE